MVCHLRLEKDISKQKKSLAKPKGSLGKFLIDSEKIRLLFKETGIQGHFRTPPSEWFGPDGNETAETLTKVLERLSKEYCFELPEDPALRLFYKLGNMDFDGIYLYSPYFREYVISYMTTLSKVNHLAEGLSRLMPLKVLAIYETDRFAIPKLRLYAGGKLQMESAAKGTEAYSEDYSKKDHEKMMENFGKIVKMGLFDSITHDDFLGRA